VPKAQTRKSARQQSVNVLTAPVLAKCSWLVHGFSTRAGGYSSAYGTHDLNLSLTGEDKRDAVEKNREVFRRALGAVDGRDQAWPIVWMRQIHSDIIHVVDRVPETTLAGDGLITRAPGLLLAAKTADCTPILIVDPVHHVVGTFHAGWRGTLKRIVEKGVGEMRKHFGSNPAKLRAAIGPCIGHCCYQVGQEVMDKFATQFAYYEDLFEIHREDSDVVHLRYPLLFLTARAPGHSELPEKILLNLQEANRRQLLDAGLKPQNISVIELCTSCRPDLLFSHRAQHGKTGRMMNVVGIKPGKHKRG
jgi:hypothetical protein